MPKHDISKIDEPNKLPIRVYFETDKWYSEHVASFRNEETYQACLPALEKLAKEHGFDFVSDSADY